MKKNATRNILNKLVLCMVLTLAMVFVLLPQVKVKAAGNEASVTWSYYVTDSTGDNVLKNHQTIEYATLKEAFAATSNSDLNNYTPVTAQGESFNWKRPPLVKLLKKVSISESYPLDGEMYLDLNGCELSVHAGGSITGEGYISINSDTPGNFTMDGGLINVGFGGFTGDTYTISGGQINAFGTDGGTIRIRGGVVDMTMGMIDNGGDADIDFTISNGACIKGVRPGFIEGHISTYSPDLHLTLSGGYYDADPRVLFKETKYEYNEETGTATLVEIKQGYRYMHVGEIVSGYTYYIKQDNQYSEIATGSITADQLDNGDIYICYKDIITVDESKIEAYNNQTDWAADPAVYKWRIKDENATDVTGISLSKAELNLTVGASETLQAKVLPANATGAAVTWSSNNPSVAEVKEGVVTAKAAGKAVITATAGGKSANCLVTVTAGQGDKPGEVISGQKKDNPATFKAKKLTLKQKDLKKKAKTFALEKYITITGAKGAVTCKLKSAKLKKKNAKKSFKLNAKTGKLTVKKGTKKGTYKLTFTVKAAGDDSYKAAEQSVTVTVKVK